MKTLQLTQDQVQELINQVERGIRERQEHLAEKKELLINLKDYKESLNKKED